MDGDQASYISIPGFDNVFGGIVRSIHFAQKISERAMVSTGVRAMLDGAAHKRGGIDWRGMLRWCSQNPGRRKRQ